MKSVIQIAIGFLAFAVGVGFVYLLLPRKQSNEIKIEVSQKVAVEDKQKVNRPIEENSNEEIEKLPLNPYALHKYINENESFDINKLWKKLGMNAKLDMVYSHIGIEIDENYDDKFEGLSDCREESNDNLTHIIKLDIDGDKNSEIMLKLCDDEKVRFLVFKKERNSWNFIGHADHDVSRYYEPIPRIRKLGNKYFLVFECQGISGTGVSLDYERWFEVNREDKLKEVLSIVKSGYECGSSANLCREFKGKVISLENNTIKVAYKINFTGNAEFANEKCKGDKDGDLHLFKRNQIGNYKFDDAKGEYVLDEKTSTITKREITTAYIPDYLDDDEASKIYEKEFQQLAKSSNSCKRDWFKRWNLGVENN